MDTIVFRHADCYTLSILVADPQPNRNRNCILDGIAHTDTITDTIAVGNRILDRNGNGNQFSHRYAHADRKWNGNGIGTADPLRDAYWNWKCNRDTDPHRNWNTESHGHRYADS